MRKVSDMTDEEKRELSDILKKSAAEFKQLREYYTANKGAIDFLYSEDFEKQRYEFLKKITELRCEACFGAPVSEDLKKALSLPAKTIEDKENKLLAIYDVLDMGQLIALYNFIMPKMTLYLPTSSPINQINRFFSAIATGNLPEKPGKGDFHITKRPKESGGEALEIVFRSTDNYITAIRFSDSALVTALTSPTGGRRAKAYKGLRKMFIFLIVLCNQKNFREEFSFDIKGVMVDEYKMYASAQKAKEALCNYGQMIIDGLKFSIVTSHMSEDESKSTLSSFDTGAPSFIKRIKADNGTKATIYLERTFDFSALAENYTLFPKWGFALDPNPFALLQYIFERARQSSPSLKQNGYFDMSFDAIRQNMGLPAPGDKNDYVKIKKPIEDAISKIEASIKENGENGIKLEPIMKNGADIVSAKTKEWLNFGALRVLLSGEYKHYYDDRLKDMVKKQKKAEKEQLKAVAEADAKEVHH